MKEEITDQTRIEHAMLAIKEIQTFIEGSTEQDFLDSSMLRSACMHQLSIIGDAFANLSKNIRNEYKDIDWRGFIGLRIRVVHIYFGIDDELVWKIIKNELTDLYTELEKINKKF